MALLGDTRQLAREGDARVRSSARAEVRRLEADIERLTDELGLRAARLYSGEDSEESVREVEAELDELGRELRRARAAHAYVS